MTPFDSVATRLVPARAEENGLYVAYANYTGSEGEFKYCGLSCLCGPDGEDIARAGRESELIFGEISPQTLQARRELSPYLQGIRPELY
jgi:predicted amidohydrolase